MCIVSIDHRHTGTAQSSVDRTFFVRDFFQRTHALQMRALRIVDDSNRRLRECAQVSNLARLAHPHLDHGSAMKITQREQRQGHTDVVIQIAAGGEHRLLTEALMAGLGAQDRGAHLLDRGLAVATGHADQRQREARTPCARQGAEGKPTIVNHHYWQRRHRIVCIPTRIDQGSGGACAGGGGKKFMPIETLTAQGDE